MNTRTILILLLVLALAGDVALAVQYQKARADVARLTENAVGMPANEKIVNFALLFIEKVLRAPKEGVSFDDRLKLETEVRELKNETVRTAWDRFIGSTDEAEAQEEVKNLLEVLLENIRG